MPIRKATYNNTKVFRPNGMRYAIECRDILPYESDTATAIVGAIKSALMGAMSNFKGEFNSLPDLAGGVFLGEICINGSSLSVTVMEILDGTGDNTYD